MDRARVLLGGVLILLLVVGTSVTAESQKAGIQSIIERLIDNTTNPFQQALMEVYALRNFNPIWIAGSALNVEGENLMEALSRADRQGLNPADYDHSELRWLEHTAELFSNDQKILLAHVLARFEVVLSINYLKFTNHLTNGRISATQRRGEWYLDPQRPSPTQWLSQAINEGVVSTLSALTCVHAGYASLLEALQQYRRMDIDGSWPVIADGPLLAQGMKDERVNILRLRLVAMGDLKESKHSLIFDRNLVEAVKNFQARHGLSVDGLVGPRTLESLNVPVHFRIRQVLVNLERHRWMPPSLGPEYLLVNIPDFRLTGYRNSEEHLMMQAKVEKPLSLTSIFGDVVENVVFNPLGNDWQDIPKEVNTPNHQEDSAHSEMEESDTNNSSRPTAVADFFIKDSRQVGTNRISPIFVMTNRLGRMTLMFSHAQPVKVRALSSDEPGPDSIDSDNFPGSIRVERILDLASFFLQEQGTQDHIIFALDDVHPRTVHLPHGIPIYIFYLTAWVDGDGTLQFREDLHGHDEQLWRTLEPILTPRVPARPPASYSR